ncbi:rhamnose-binding lectin-like [Orbicella faveolata]|uniref:rhamnose-binding lectin-like n=1 Tax=Orbicella faveolata TaxID=48498 RepID=UPI0009E234D1|nr:rhamnose-binding lectin-like [Orbicella faveolata]
MNGKLLLVLRLCFMLSNDEATGSALKKKRYAEPRQTTICEGNRNTINCHEKQISVVEASYGRHDRSTCSHSAIYTTSCHAGNSLSIVRSKCNYRSSCTLEASNSVFGDPCHGTYKYLRVTYKCTDQDSLTICEGDRNTINCHGKRISVVDASYGRHDRSTCSHSEIYTTSCHAKKDPLFPYQVAFEGNLTLMRTYLSTYQ